ncbi:MAG: hypothetical protein HC927_11600 [Deltaproteobacteria bacterium]|nr:hypothetical protein [Deltaproteobacteria bacterium]
MSYPVTLLEHAQSLVEQDERGRPRQADLRRAVSAAYYAVFHEVCIQAGQLTLGKNQLASPIGIAARRSIEHATVRRACLILNDTSQLSKLRTDHDNKTPTSWAKTTTTILTLQEARTNADYDLSQGSNLKQAAASQHIADARTVLNALRATPTSDLEAQDRQIFLIACLVGKLYRPTPR